MKRDLAATMAVATAGVLPVFLTGALGVQLQEDLGFGEAGLGACASAFFASAALGSPLAGRVVERTGPTTAMRAAALLSAATLVLLAVGTRSLASLLALLLLAGAANAVTQPAANLFVARAVDARRQGLAFGVKQSAGPMATLLGGLAVPAVALTAGWRWAYAGAAVLAVLGAALVRPLAPRPGAPQHPPERDAPLGPLVSLGAGAGFGAAAALALGSFLVTAAVDAGMGEASAGLLAALGSVVGLTSRLAVGARADRPVVARGALATVSRMLVAGAACYLLLAVGSVPLLVVVTPLAFATGWGWHGLFNYGVVQAAPAAPGRATGITQVGNYLGAVAGPLAFGLIATTSIRAAWVAAAALAVLGALTIRAADRRLLALR